MILCLYFVALIISWGILTGRKSTVELTQKSLIGTIRLFDYKRLFYVSSSSHPQIPNVVAFFYPYGLAHPSHCYQHQPESLVLKSAFYRLD